MSITPKRPDWVTDDALLRATQAAVDRKIRKYEDDVRRAEERASRREEAGLGSARPVIAKPKGYVLPYEVAEALILLHPERADEVKDAFFTQNDGTWSASLGRAIKSRLDAMAVGGNLTRVGGTNGEVAPAFDGSWFGTSTYARWVYYAPTSIVEEVYAKAVAAEDAKRNEKFQRRDAIKAKAEGRGIHLDSINTTQVTLSLDEFEALLDAHSSLIRASRSVIALEHGALTTLQRAVEKAGA